MKNSEYWEKRIANSTWNKYNSIEEENRALLKMYQEATVDIQNELYTIAQKINGGKNVTLSDMHKYNRLTQMQKNMENTIKQLTENIETYGTTKMVNAGKEVYKNVISSISDTSFSTPNERVMKEMLNRPWQGDTFSKRLWKNSQALAINLNYILTIGLTQGKTITELAIQLGNRMNQEFNKCHRLVRTETMHYLNESAFKAYKDGGCEEVQLWAAEDERTCEKCGALHGKKYRIDKRPILPLHANCRCTYLPVVLPESLSQKDIVVPNSVGAMAKKIYVKKDKIELKQSISSDKIYLKQGTHITGVKVIAGKGVRRDIDDINRLVNTYKLSNGELSVKDDWQKVRGTAIVTDGVNELKAEVHWYQCENIGKVEWKIKRIMGDKNEN